MKPGDAAPLLTAEPRAPSSSRGPWYLQEDMEAQKAQQPGHRSATDPTVSHPQTPERWSRGHVVQVLSTTPSSLAEHSGHANTRNCAGSPSFTSYNPALCSGFVRISRTLVASLSQGFNANVGRNHAGAADAVISPLASRARVRNAPSGGETVS